MPFNNVGIRAVSSLDIALALYISGVIFSTMKVRFYVDAGGQKPVGHYLHSLSDTEHAAVAHALRQVERYGLSVVDARQIDGKLWEIRTPNQRVFYVLVDGPTLVVLHAYKKEGQKAPKNDLEIATARMQEVLEVEEARKQAEKDAVEKAKRASRKKPTK